MSEHPATYRPSSEVHAIYRALLAATMDPCACEGDKTGMPCFRWAERGIRPRATPPLCTACDEGYHAHETGHGGYGGEMRSGDTGDGQRALDTLRSHVAEYAAGRITLDALLAVAGAA
jgi:hypothetical protein